MDQQRNRSQKGYFLVVGECNLDLIVFLGNDQIFRIDGRDVIDRSSGRKGTFNGCNGLLALGLFHGFDNGLIFQQAGHDFGASNQLKPDDDRNEQNANEGNASLPVPLIVLHVHGFLLPHAFLRPIQPHRG